MFLLFFSGICGQGNSIWASNHVWKGVECVVYFLFCFGFEYFVFFFGRFVSAFHFFFRYGMQNEWGLSIGESTGTGMTVGWATTKPWGHCRVGPSPDVGGGGGAA